MHTINVQFSETKSNATNNYSGVTNVAGEAGIFTGATDPFYYGVPTSVVLELREHPRSDALEPDRQAHDSVVLVGAAVEDAPVPRGRRLPHRSNR